jgi:hypothetical protein
MCKAENHTCVAALFVPRFRILPGMFFFFTQAPPPHIHKYIYVCVFYWWSSIWAPCGVIVIFGWHHEDVFPTIFTVDPPRGNVINIHLADILHLARRCHSRPRTVGDPCTLRAVNAGDALNRIGRWWGVVLGFQSRHSVTNCAIHKQRTLVPIKCWISLRCRSDSREFPFTRECCNEFFGALLQEGW